MSAQALETRMAVAEERIEWSERELLRTRERLHDLEAERATVRLLTRQVTDLTNSIERIATRAAERAVELTLNRRDEIGRSRWGLRAQWLSVGMALGVFVVMVLALTLGGK